MKVKDLIFDCSCNFELRNDGWHWNASENDGNIPPTWVLNKDVTNVYIDTEKGNLIIEFSVYRQKADSENEIIIVVDDGFVETVFSTEKDCDVRVIDLDGLDYEDRSSLEDEIYNIASDVNYTIIY